MENKDENLFVINTYKNDMKEALEQKEQSTEAIMIAEVNQKELRNEIKRPIPRKPHPFFAIIIVVLVCLSLGYFWYNKNNQKQNSKAIEVPSPYTFPKQINASAESVINISNEYSKQNLLNKIEAGKTGSVAGINSFVVFSKDYQLTSTDFLTLISPNNLPVFSKIEPQFIFANNKTENSSDLFFVFKTKDYYASKKELYDSEKKLAQDFQEIFGYKLYTDMPIFSDKMYQSKNIRAFYQNDQLNLFYYFLNKEYFIVGNNLESLTQIEQSLQL